MSKYFAAIALSGVAITSLSSVCKPEYKDALMLMALPLVVVGVFLFIASHVD